MDNTTRPQQKAITKCFLNNYCQMNNERKLLLPLLTTLWTLSNQITWIQFGWGRQLQRHHPHQQQHEILTKLLSRDMKWWIFKVFLVVMVLIVITPPNTLPRPMKNTKKTHTNTTETYCISVTETKKKVCKGENKNTKTKLL